MSIGSHTELARRIPIQERGERRVAGLLEAAAAIFPEVGYEAATMRDIAEASDVLEQDALLCVITIQMVRALMWLYLENERSEREALAVEMKFALVDCLSPRLVQQV